MDEGVIVEEGSPEVIFGHPTHERTREFLARILGDTW
jgi:putative lysine transport system ATP-binding protein